MIRSTTALVLSLLISPVLSLDAQAQSAMITEQEAHAIGVNAYLYFYSLLSMDISIVHRLAGVVFQLRVVGVEKAADTRMARSIDVDQLAILPHAASSPDVYFGLRG